MAYAYSFFENFVLGTRGNFDSETDTDSKLDWQHHSQLARRLVLDESAWSGPYAMHINLATGTADAVVTETGGFDTAASADLGVGFAFMADGLTMAASDRFTVCSVDSAGPVAEAVVDVRNNAGTIEILASETGAGATVRASSLIQGRWYWVELHLTLDSGAGNDGILRFYLDGQQIGTNITALDQAAITQLRLGAVDIDAGTTAGRLFFGSVYGDNARIGLHQRFPHLGAKIVPGYDCIVGPGCATISISSTSNDAMALLYDTDDPGNGAYAGRLLGVVRADGYSNTLVDVEWQRGLFIEAGGTNPLVSCRFHELAVNSVAQLMQYGFDRLPTP